MTRSAASRLAAVGRRFYDRNWVLGTSGNFSVVVSRRPLVLAITPSGANKGQLTGREILRVDEAGTVVGSNRISTRRPSAEMALHLEIVRARDAGAVLHTHSVWGTILSEIHAQQGGMAIDGYEMLKGLDGVASHEHREWLPVIANDQDMPRLARAVRAVLERHRGAHGFLIRGHGLYTWGATLDVAERHVEILEFLLEAVGRKESHGDRHHS